MNILNSILLLIIPFYIEISLCILILLSMYHFLFNINSKLHNDNFPLESIALFLSLSFFIILYLFIKDIAIITFTHRLFSIESNNLLIKLFLLIQFSILCLL